MNRGVAVAALAGVLVAAAVSSTFARTSAAGPVSVAANSPTRIVYEAFDPELRTSRVYSINPTGTGRRVISKPPAKAADGQPDVSPDGSKVIFRRSSNLGTPNERTDVMVANIDGSDVRNLTETSCTGDCLGSEEPGWSPDGTQIAFMRAIGPIPRNGPPPIVGLFVMDADGSNVRQLTQLVPNSGTEDHTPGWSPDGETIIFMRSNNTIDPVDASAIYSIDADGGEPAQIRKMPRKWPGSGAEAEFSPDGARILYDNACLFGACGQPITGAQVFTIARDGSDRRRLTDLPGNAYDASWSPDGSKIVFSRNEELSPTGDLFTMRADGTHIRRLTHSLRRDNHNADWAVVPQ